MKTYRIPLLLMGLGCLQGAQLKEDEQDSSSESFDEPIVDKCKPFIFSNLKEKKEKPFSKKAPNYRRLVEGMNLEGICMTKSCRAYRKKVWVQCGFGEFFMAEVVSEAVCPLCKEVDALDELETVGFVNCNYTIKYRKRKCPMEEKKGSHKGIKGFEKFEGGKGKNEEYLFMKITVIRHKSATKGF